MNKLKVEIKTRKMENTAGDDYWIITTCRGFDLFKLKAKEMLQTLICPFFYAVIV